MIFVDLFLRPREIRLRAGGPVCLVLGDDEWHEEGYQHSRASDTGECFHRAGFFCTPIALSKPGAWTGTYFVPRWIPGVHLLTVDEARWRADAALQAGKQAAQAKFDREMARLDTIEEMIP